MGGGNDVDDFQLSLSPLIFKLGQTSYLSSFRGKIETFLRRVRGVTEHSGNLAFASQNAENAPMPRTEFLSFSPPDIGDLEIEKVTTVLKDGQWLSSGPMTKAFEEQFAQRIGAKTALALNSCTAGLHLAMVVHEVGPDTEVITTPMTFCATANVVEHVGGRVVLADIEPDTLLISPQAIEEKLTKSTQGIMPVHYAGQPCDMAAIDAMAKSKGLFVVEDAAHAIPSKIDSKWVGSSENLTVFSFYATKNITSGEGGMITGSEELMEKVRVLALHGMSRNAWDRFKKGGSWKYDVLQPGFKYNLPDLASALGLAQLERLDELYAKRMKVVNAYEAEFQKCDWLKPLKTRAGVQSAHHLYVVRLQLEQLKIDRDRFIVELAERNIGASVHYTPLHMLTYYNKKYGWKPEDFPNATKAFREIVSLPLSSKMTSQDVHDVIEAVLDIGKQFKR